MSGPVHVEISNTPLSLEMASAFVADPAYGAIDVFIGAVRNHHEGRAVEGISYDIHQTLAEKVLRDICKEAGGMWPETKYYVSHYFGNLNVGGISVIIAVGAAHRAEAFEACRYIIEEIKKRAPVWKKEHYTDGESVWLPGHSLVEETDVQAVCCGKCNAG
jgi:molybdopterin synthase catalytic subunit